MILCDHQIEKAIGQGRLIVDPAPAAGQFDSSSLNLRVGDDFRVWNPGLRTAGTGHSIELDRVRVPELLDLTVALRPNERGLVTIRPGDFVLVPTREFVSLPLKSKLAARVEGRSGQARLGMGVHITAPTIHAGFSGTITLEVLNHGPFQLELRPNETKICQLIIETVSAIPRRAASVTFAQQRSPLGPPRRKKDSESARRT